MSRILTGHGGNGHSVITMAEMPPHMMKPNIYASQSVTDKMKDLETPADYWEQVKRARQLWAIYGKDTAKYADPLVTAIMDLMVSVTVSFGTENLLKDVPPDSPAKEVLDHWCATVNKGEPMLTQGLDAFRKQAHRGRWGDGGAVVAWSRPVQFQTPSGISYKAPDQLAALPRPNFMVKSSEEFGGFELAWKDTGVSFSGSDLEEIGDDEKTGEIQNMLSERRYVVFDRNRMESAQKYPVPYLVARGLTGICARIRLAQRGDYQTVGRVIKALLLITQGAKEWMENTDWMPSDAIAALAGLKSDVAAEGGGYNNVITGPYSTTAQWVTPDLDGLLSAEKYTHDDYERLAALGILRALSTEMGRQYEFNPKPLLMEIWDAMLEDRRLVEGRLFPILWENNPKIFEGIQPANFHQKPITIFMSETEKKTLMDLYKAGLQTVGSVLENIVGFGSDAEAEANRKEHEARLGYEEIFKPPVAFTQSVRRDITERSVPTHEEEEEISVSAGRRKLVLPDKYDSLRRQILEIAQSSETTEQKKRAIGFLVAGMIAAWGIDLKERVRDFYASQFASSNVVWHGNIFEPYIVKTGQRLEKFGVDLLEGGAGGTTGIYVLLDADADDLSSELERVLNASIARLSLYEREPFKVARMAGQASKALNRGRKYAVRHSAFAKTTCQECIDLHGKVYSIEQLFAGDIDHPNGLCWFTYHTSEVQAALEAEEMLTIDEINSIISRMEEDDEMVQE